MAIDKDGLMSRHKDVVHLLEKNLKYLESVGVDASLISDYKKTVSYLKSRTLVEVMHVLGAGRKGGSRNAEDYQFDEHRIGEMSLDDVVEKLNSPKTTRRSMEKIAIARFGMTKGGLSNLHSREALKAKIESMLNNELAHSTISRVARESGVSHKPVNE